MDAQMKIKALLNPKEDMAVSPSHRRGKGQKADVGIYHVPPNADVVKIKQPSRARNEVVLSNPRRNGYQGEGEELESEDNYPASSALTDHSKVWKDENGTVWCDGDPFGRVHYPPWYPKHSKYKKAFEKLQLNPFSASRIARNEKTIPYTSDKRGFGAKTGRDHLDVLQYEYSYPEGRTWVVMWDFKLGLVRITPFFKSLNYAKTQPRKAITKNPGLEEICYSITGGALAAQGYWMPYEAAMHLTATFCWKIRFALFPLFGEEFLKICVPPDDPTYESFTIAKSVVQQCAEETKNWSPEANQRYSSAEPPETPSRPLSSSSLDLQAPTASNKQNRSKRYKRDQREVDDTDMNDELSDSFEDFTPKETPSPQLGFTAINRQPAPRKSDRRPTRASPNGPTFPSAYLFRSKSPTPSSSSSYMPVEKSEGIKKTRHESDDRDVPIKVSRTSKKTTPRNTPSKRLKDGMQLSNSRSQTVSKTRQQRTPGKYHADEYNGAQALVFMAAGGHEKDRNSMTGQMQREKDRLGSPEDDEESVSSINEKGPKRGRGLKNVSCKKKTKFF